MSTELASGTAGYLTPFEAADHLRISSDTLIALVRDGRLHPCRNPAGAVLFSREDLDRTPTALSTEAAAEALTHLFSEQPMPTSPAAGPAAPTSSSSAIVALMAEIRAHLADQLRAGTLKPQWLDIQDAAAVFSAPAKTIKAWAAAGFVRKAKLGTADQSKAVYAADDLADVLARLAAGKTPVVALRRGS